MRSRILVVEDDDTIGASLVRALEVHGYDTEWVTNAAAARAAVQDLPPDLVLLDLGLPDADGVDVCAELQRARPGLPVVMLTARQEEADVVVGLNAGAVDYVVKPFRLAELLARVSAHLRSAAISAPDEGALTVGDLAIDRAARRAWIGDAEIELRVKEFDLLVRLAVDAGRVVARETLMEDVWDEHWFGSTKTLDVHIAALRRRLGEGPGQASRITSIRGVGYRLERP